ncbi:MAG: hypothetical protein ABJF50_09300 [Paracoccaceae bacterium]
MTGRYSDFDAPEIEIAGFSISSHPRSELADVYELDFSRALPAVTRNNSQNEPIVVEGMSSGIILASIACSLSHALIAGGDTTPETGSPMIGKTLVVPVICTPHSFSTMEG